MLKGFIDLVFRHEGRYYLLDYKSNWLGEDSSAYTQQAMAAVQFFLYPVRVNRPGKIEVFKQTVQERPR